MGLRLRIALLLVATLAVLAGLVLTLLRWDTERQVQRLEQAQVSADLRRVLLTLEAQSQQLNGVLVSWANWSALYQHLEHPDPAFRAEEITPQSLQVGLIDWLVLFNDNGNLLDMVEVPQSDGSLPATQQLHRNAHQLPAYFNAQGRQRRCGVTQAESRLAFVCFSPVYTSEGFGPSRGLLAMARWITPETVAQAVSQTGIDFELVPLQAMPNPHPLQGSIRSLLGQGEVHVTATDTVLDIRFPVTSVLAWTVGELRLRSPRRHRSEALENLRSLQRTMLLLVLASGLVIVLLMDRAVVRRLDRLQRELDAIMARPDWSGQVSVQGQDEIARLAGFADRLLGVVRSQMVELRQLSTTDALTGLPNRRAFDAGLARALLRQAHQGHPAALILVDVDHFKAYNDRHGHPAGDEVLRRIAQCLRGVLKHELDLAVRLGGEEFGLLLESPQPLDGPRCAEALRLAVMEAALPHGASATASVVTVSCGVAQLRASDDASSFYRRADEALYAAKASGRNRVCVEPAPD